MIFEKLGLVLFLNTFTHLETVKNHLQVAVKEVLLAIESTFEMVLKSPPASVLGSNKETLELVLSPVQKMLSYAINKVTPEELPELTSAKHPLKENVVQSIVSAIDDEIEGTRDLTTDKSKLKIEALQTVKKVLMQQLKSTGSSSEKSIRHVNVA